MSEHDGGFRFVLSHVSIELRPYQLEALQAIEAAEARGVRRPLLGLPTGTGKTVIFSALIAKRGATSLVLAHRDELIEQAARKVRQIAPELRVGIVKAERDELDVDVVIASVQTLSRPKRLALLRRDFTTVVVDEAHHAAADSYLRVLDWVSAAGLTIGVTATPERADKRALGDVWDEIVYTRTILDMIRSGYLADLRGLRVRLDVDFSKLRVRHGDYIDSEAAALLEQADAPAHTARAFSEHAADRKALVFTSTVALAYEMVAAFRAEGISCEAVHGTLQLDERRAILARLQSGETRVVANCAVLTEGFDEPSVDCIVIARPTRSRGLYTQMIGRGTRTFPNKTDCLIMDLVGATDRHDLLTLPQLFKLDSRALDRSATVREAADEADETAVALADAKAIAEEIDLFASRPVLAWIKYGERWLLEMGRGQLWLEPHVDLWRVLFVEDRSSERQLVATDVDLGYAHGIAEDLVRRLDLQPLVAADAPWRRQPATTKQLEFVRALGGNPEPNVTRGEASDLIARLKAQRSQDRLTATR